MQQPGQFGHHQPPKEKNNQNFLGVVLLLGAALFFAFLATLPEEKPAHRSVASKPQSAYSPQAESRVNEHLFMTSKKMELEQQRAAIKNQYYAPSVGDSVWPKHENTVKSYGVDHSPDTNEGNVYRDLNRDSKDVSYESPNAVIQGQMYDQEKQKTYEDEYKKEYARQFVENARLNGYAITLDSNYTVIRVMPIRKPSQESTKIFNSSGEGTR